MFGHRRARSPFKIQTCTVQTNGAAKRLIKNGWTVAYVDKRMGFGSSMGKTIVLQRTVKR